MNKNIELLKKYGAKVTCIRRSGRKGFMYRIINKKGTIVKVTSLQNLNDFLIAFEGVMR